MKRWILRILSVGLTLMLCAGAAAETTDGISYTMSEKLMKQLEAGSGFVGTLTLTSAAVQGRETEAFSTAKPLAMDWTYIHVNGDEEAGTAGETRIKLTMDSSGYQQGSAEASLQDGTLYLLSSLTGDSWIQIDLNAFFSTLKSALGSADTLGVLPDTAALSQLRGMLPASLSFFTGMAGYLVTGNVGDLSETMEQYTTKIDFWLEGYRDSVQMDTSEDGSSVMTIQYRIPPAAVKAQLKQFLVDLMSDDALLAELASLMPEGQAEQFLTPSLQPYYFYAVNELPLEDDLFIRRVVSFMGDTMELSVTMPMYDSQNGAMTLQYTRKQNGEDMPDENLLSLTAENSQAELSYHTYETMTGSNVYQGTVRIESTLEGDAKPETLWASFDISASATTTKDLNGYETQNLSLKVSVAPGETDSATDTQEYIVFPAMDVAVDAKVASLSAKNAPTDTSLTVTLSGAEMPQEIKLELSGTTTSKWTPEAFDAAQAVVLADLTQEDQNALVSQAVVKGGLLFLPYINLPQLTTQTTE